MFWGGAIWGFHNIVVGGSSRIRLGVPLRISQGRSCGISRTSGHTWQSMEDQIGAFHRSGTAFLGQVWLIPWPEPPLNPLDSLNLHRQTQQIHVDAELLSLGRCKRATLSDVDFESLR